MKRPHRTLLPLCLLPLAALVPGAGCGQKEPPPTDSARATPTEGTDLAAARARFTTRLRKRGPAPQAYEDVAPSPGVRLVEYPSGDLKLKAWLSDDPGDGKRHPAVVYLHGGWSFAPDDWRDAAPFARAGFVLLMPMLRGENGNPGTYEGFYGEVDDAVAAGRFAASLPYVDPGRVCVAGHSVGAVLAVLTAMVPSAYKTAAALSGYLEMKSWSAFESADRVVFDPADAEEVRLRNPMAFVASLRCPVTLFAEPAMRPVNEPFAAEARRLGKECELVIVPGDHMTMVAPAVRQAIERFRRHPGR